MTIFRFNKRARTRKRKLAFWFRYGPAEYAVLTAAFPEMVRRLSRSFELVCIGFHSREHPIVPPEIASLVRVVSLPVSIGRADNRDKTVKTFLWIALLPVIALVSLLIGVRYVYIDETLPLALPIARLFFGKRATITLVDLYLDQYCSKGFFRRVLRNVAGALDHWAWRHAPFLFARSAAAPPFLAKRFGIDPERVFVAYDAVDFALYHPFASAEERMAARAKFGWHSDDIVLVFHGVLNPAKDLDTVFDVMPRALLAHPTLRLVLLGNGADEGRLRKKAADFGISNAVTFGGYTPAAVVASALAAADIGLVARHPDDASHLVVTSVLGHCLAAGLPVLASKTAGISALVESEKNGLLYEAGSGADFLRQLQRLCNDPFLRMHLAAAGLQTARSALSIEETALCNTRPFFIYWGTQAEI